MVCSRRQRARFLRWNCARRRGDDHVAAGQHRPGRAIRACSGGHHPVGTETAAGRVADLGWGAPFGRLRCRLVRAGRRSYQSDVLKLAYMVTLPISPGYRMRSMVAALVLSSAALHTAWAADAITFPVDHATQATIEVQGDYVHYELRGPAGTRTARIATQTEKPVHLEVADYDFSGQQGFAFWSIDEGQGVSKIYRIFTFSQKRNDFVERHPRCGDAFLNLRVDARRKQLISTFFENNTPKSCTTQLHSD